MATFIQLLKREVIEHRNGMLLTPVIIAALMAFALIVGAVTGSDVINFRIDEADRIEAMSELEAELEGEATTVRNALGLAMHVLGMPMLGVALIVALFMLLGSLYDERSERTILFWKSMPVTDTMTVLSKLATGALLIPFVAAIVGFALQIFALIVFTIFGTVNKIPVGAEIWTLTPLFTVWMNTLVMIVMGALWAAPVYAWFLLASAWAPRSPFLVAVVPIVTIAVMEALLRESAWFISEVGNRIIGGAVFDAIGERIGEQDHFHGDNFDLSVSGINVTFSDIMTLLSMPGLWVGLGVAALLITLAIHVRRTKTL